MGSCSCLSLRGALYFASSIHICLGLCLTGYLIFVLIYANFSHHGFTKDHTFFLVLILYSLTFLILGCCIFRGIDKKSSKLLKPATIIFAIIHSLIFARVIYVLTMQMITGIPISSAPPTYTTSNKQNISNEYTGLLIVTLFFLLTALYLVLLLAYMKSLPRRTSSLYNINNNFYSNVQLNADGSAIHSYDPSVCNT